MQSKGLTLIELLISAGILAFAICGLIFQVNNGILLNKINRDFTVALSHAQYVLEGMKNTPRLQLQTDIINGVWNWNTILDFNSNGLTRIRHTAGDENIVTNFVAGNPLGVIVRVSWNDPRPRQIQLRTLFN